MTVNLRRKHARIIQKLGFDAKFAGFKIHNIVDSCDVEFCVRLEGLASRPHISGSYQPELLPGLIYRMMKPKVVLLILVSRKNVLAGAKVREEIYQAFRLIHPVPIDLRKTYSGFEARDCTYGSNANYPSLMQDWQLRMATESDRPSDADNGANATHL